MNILEIKNLKKSYPSPEGISQLIVDIPAFELKENEQMALAGESGSGKTTFLNLVAGILQADEGSLILGGKELGSLSESQRDLLRAQTLGYIFQNFNLLQGYTALENVKLGMMFGAGVDLERAILLLKRMGLSERLHHYPRQLSMGQQQRVAVARALANHPKLILADEPTAHLDHIRGQEAITLMQDLCREFNAALLVVSHDREVLSQFKQVKPFEQLNRALHARQGVKS